MQHNICHRWDDWSSVCRNLSDPPPPLCCPGLAEEEDWIKCMCAIFPQIPLDYKQTAINLSELDSSLVDLPDLDAAESTKPKKMLRH